GLTTAASIWVTASIGMACGAGLPLLAVMATLLHLFAVWTLGLIGRKIQVNPPESVITLRYREGLGALRNALGMAAEIGFEALVKETSDITRPGKPVRYEAVLALRPVRVRANASEVLDSLVDIDGVISVKIADQDND